MKKLDDDENHTRSKVKRDSSPEHKLKKLSIIKFGEIDNLNKNIDFLKNKTTRLMSEKQDLEMELHSVETSYADLESKLKRSNLETTALKTSLGVAYSDVKQLETKKSELLKTLELNDEKYSQKCDELEASNIKIVEKEHENEYLKHHVKMGIEKFELSEEQNKKNYGRCLAVHDQLKSQLLVEQQHLKRTKNEITLLKKQMVDLDKTKKQKNLEKLIDFESKMVKYIQNGCNDLFDNLIEGENNNENSICQDIRFQEQSERARRRRSTKENDSLSKLNIRSTK